MRDYRQRKKTEIEDLLSRRYHVLPKSDVIPLYNPEKHKTGDKVRMSTGQVVVVPELDIDGNPISWCH